MPEHPQRAVVVGSGGAGTWIGAFFAVVFRGLFTAVGLFFAVIGFTAGSFGF